MMQSVKTRIEEISVGRPMQSMGQCSGRGWTVGGSIDSVIMIVILFTRFVGVQQDHQDIEENRDEKTI